LNTHKGMTRRRFVGMTAGGLGLLTQASLNIQALDFIPNDNLPAGSYLLRNKAGIAVSIDSKAGKYIVTFKGKSWFGTGIVSVLSDSRWYRSIDTAYPEVEAFKQQGRLVFKDAETGSASDSIGTFDFVDLTWSLPGTNADLTTSFRLYRDQPVLTFVQKYPNGFPHYASGNWIVPSVTFPQFVMERSCRRDLYSWISGGMWEHRRSYGPASSSLGTVDLLLLTDEENETVILSPFANYLTATQQSLPLASNTETNPTKAFISCGIEGLVEELPAGFEHQHIMVVGQGVNRTFKAWGDTLLARAGKLRPSKYTGDTLKYPTYWDDYGSYYRQHNFKEEGFKSYEDIVLGIAEDARKNGLRIGAYQVQDLDQLRNGEGLFEPRQDLFPHGLKWLREKLGVPLEAYFAWLPPNGPYRKKYEFYKTPAGVVPEYSMGDVFHTEQFWKDTAEKLVSWGTTLMQHDFLSTYEGNSAMMSGVDKMDGYFRNMTKALQEKGINMQYCMALPRNIMQSTENPIILSLQGSLDHHVPTAEAQSTYRAVAIGNYPDEDLFAWKQLMFASAFYGAVGLWPSRDNIQTMADPNAYEDTLLANLLGGEIQLGHKIGECNFDLLKKTYRDGDCLILKPDRPIAPLDRCYREKGLVGYTHSEHNGRNWFYVFSLPRAGYLPSFRVSDLGTTGKWAVYNHESHTVTARDADSPIELSEDAKCEYLILAPIFDNGMTVIGDVSKFVTMAEMRIASVESSGDSLRVGVISNQNHSPIITGYSAVWPKSVQGKDESLAAVTSVDQLQKARSGWFWDYQTRLWHVKVDFKGATAFETRSFQLSL